MPFHRAFDEVNLRFYVRRQSRMATSGAAWCSCASSFRAWRLRSRRDGPTTSRIARSRCGARRPTLASTRPGAIMYEWRTGGAMATSRCDGCRDAAASPGPTSEAAFITEHYWGYTRQRDGSTREYEVAHPVWRVWAAVDPVLDADVVELYGAPFVRALSGPPASAFIAEGSPVVVYAPRRMTERASEDRDMMSHDIAHKETR